MKSILKFGLMAALFAVAETSAAAGTVAENAAGADAVEKGKKSIVPSKYSGKYKDGGSDAVATFIKEQSSGKEGFEFGAFFSLCRKNGIAEEKVAHYEALVADKANNHGIEGRARMTLGNMLRAKARKDSKLVGLNDQEQTFDIPKPAVSGAAAAAQTAAAEPAAEVSATETDASVEDASTAASDETSADDATE